MGKLENNPNTAAFVKTQSTEMQWEYCLEMKLDALPKELKAA